MILIRPVMDMVVDEDFETERVIVDLRNGHYFCVNESGSWLWLTLKMGPLSLHPLAHLLAERHALPVEETAAAIQTWAGILAKAGLLELGEESTPAASSPALSLPGAWSAPTVTVYGDLEHLLALDPIHEVDEAVGWPKEKAASAPLLSPEI